MVTVGQLPQTVPGAGRDQLGFVDAARSGFGFLRGLGFKEVVAEPTYLRFERDDSFVEVFHGRASYELGVEFGRWVRVDDDVVEQKFHLVDVLPVVAPESGFVARTATSREQVVRFVEEMAVHAKVAVEHLEAEGSTGFERVSEAVERQSDEYLDGLRATRVRARAEEAWRRKDFASVVAAYEEIDAELSTVELRESEAKRLSYARDRIDD